MRKFEISWENECKLKELNSFNEGIELLELNKDDFTFIHDDCMDFDFRYINEDDRIEMITFTINDDVEEDEMDIIDILICKKGYWKVTTEL